MKKSLNKLTLSYVFITFVLFSLVGSLDVFAQSHDGSDTVEIICDENDNSGILSAYTSHIFYVKSTYLNDFSSSKWKLSLPLASGEEKIIILNDDFNSCVVPSIDEIEDYEITDGLIYAFLDFSCVINDEEYNADTYSISFELRPKIEYAKIIDIKNSPERQTYDAYFEVKYFGADCIQVTAEGEYSTWVKPQTIYETYLARGVCSEIAAPFYCWIDFLAKNEYGNDKLTIELEPDGVVANPDFSNISPVLFGESEYDKETIVEVYNFQGSLVDIYANASAIENELTRGCYIVREVSQSGKSKTRKLIVK